MRKAEMKKIFSELFGFAIYDPKNLTSYIAKNKISNQDLLSYFSETQAGDYVSENGIVIPITNVEPDYYSFELNKKTSNYTIFNESRGWVLQVISNYIQIVGIGYLKNISYVNEQNSISFTVENGWYQVSISSYKNTSNERGFLLELQKITENPNFKADIQKEENWFN